MEDLPDRGRGGRYCQDEEFAVDAPVPPGWFEDDPNVTDKKFPGNPTRSFRSRAPLWIVEEVTDWKR
jgi:rifampin ADP-ribosylating transferase